MRGRVILKPQVPDDLRAILDYLERFSIKSADRFLEAVFAAFDEIAAAPGKGSPKSFRSRRLEGVRSWSVPGFRNHLILYQPVPDGITVLAVTHGSRKIRTLLLRRMP